MKTRLQRDIIDMIPCGIIETDTEGTIVSANSASCKILGLPGEVYGIKIWELFGIEEKIAIEDMLARHDQTQLIPHTIEITNRAGAYKTLQVSFNFKKNENHSITGIICLILDLKEKMQAEKALLESEKKYAMLMEKALLESENKYRTLQEDMPIGLIRTSVNGKIIYANSSLARIFGYDSLEEMLDVNIINLYHDPSQKEGFINRLIKEGIVIDYESLGRKKDGSLFWVATSVKCIYDGNKNLLYIDGYILDITEKKKTETALKKNEELYSALFHNNPIQTVVVDKEGRIIAYNRAKDLSGDRKPVKGMLMYRDYASRHSIDMYKELIDCISSGSMKEFPEQKYHDKVLSIKISPFEEGAIITSQDITLQKKAEERIEHLNELLFASKNVDQLILHEKNTGRLIQGICESLIQSTWHTDAWIVLTDKTNKATAFASARFNNAGNNTCFYKAKKNISMLNCFELIKNNAFTVLTGRSFCEECKCSSGYQTSLRVVIRLEYNNRLYGFMNIGVLEEFLSDEQEKSLLSEVAANIAFGLYNIDLEDERKELEKQLYKTARLSAVGQLAAGIAHEFNNMLSVILGHTQLSLEEDSIDEIRDSLREIEKTTKRGSGIVSKLAAFAKPKEPDFMIQDITKVIEDVISLQKRQLQLDTIKVETRFNTKINVSFDRGQMEQVFFNLIINSIHAIKPKGRGKIIITVHDVNGNAEIRFSDNGIGMDKETKTKAFDPFFTTKGAWAKDGLGISGTGLGLSIAHSIVKQHNGTIMVKSQKSKGTTFIITLPADLSGKVAENLPEYNSFDHDVKKLKEMRILLIDDENEMTEMFKQVFRKAGFENYKIENNGEKAVSIFKEFKPDIVFLDIIMPRMDGERIFREIKSIDKSTPIVFMSGKVDSEKDNYLKIGAFDYIQKPFEINEIFSILNKIVKP